MALSRAVLTVVQYGSSSKSISDTVTGDAEIEISDTVAIAATTTHPASVAVPGNVTAVFIKTDVATVEVRDNLGVVFMPVGDLYKQWYSTGPGTNPVTGVVSDILIDNSAGGAEANVEVFVLVETP